jgi:hypothetical protein
MRRAWIVFALGATIWAASTEKPRVKRAAIKAMEVSFDQRIQRLADDPFILDIARIRTKKQERFPALRQCMRDTLLNAAASLDEVPANEQIVVGVSLLYRPDEDSSGMPAQILMQGVKGQLLDAKLSGVPLDGVVKVREF